MLIIGNILETVVEMSTLPTHYHISTTKLLKYVFGMAWSWSKALVMMISVRSPGGREEILVHGSVGAKMVP